MSQRPRRIRIGLQIAQYGAGWPAFLDAAREAEAIGADALFNWDHFFGAHVRGLWPQLAPD
jgi:hypothetical protein